MERKHIQIVEIGLTLLAHVSMPITYWDQTFTTTVYLINILPTLGLPKFISPYAALYDKYREYMALKVFRLLCSPFLRPYNQHKLHFRKNYCVYLGVSPTHKGHKCLNAEGNFFIFKDVKFNEIEFPCSKLFPTIYDHKLTGIHSSHTNVPLNLPGSISTLASNILAEQTSHSTNLINDPQDIVMPASLTPILPSQISPTPNLSNGNSNDLSHVSNTFQSH